MPVSQSEYEAYRQSYKLPPERDMERPNIGTGPTFIPDEQGIEDALLHAEAEYEMGLDNDAKTCQCCHGTFCEQHDRPKTEALISESTRIETALKALIARGEKMQADLIEEVGRPSSHIHSRIKALKDALEIVTQQPVPRSEFDNT